MKDEAEAMRPDATVLARDRLAIVAHELRSPVAALVALAEAAPGVPAAERRRLLALAVAAGRDIERILGDPELLAPRLEPVDIGALLAGLEADDVEVEVDGRPWACADPTRLRQVLANLVANGLRHGSRVTIAARESQGWVVMDVTDDGPGVDPSIDPFARGVSGEGSSGLGLWLARAMAEAQDGSLEHVPGGAPGARFRLSLPSASGGG